MTRRTAALFVTVAVSLGSYAGVRCYKLTHYPRWLARVATGDTKEAVREKMGSPDVVRSRPHWLWCKVPECETEFRYGHSIPPEWWVVGFDREGRAIWTAELQSP